jgi:ABC-type multidrug transport system fused ATPase/permease subunit
MATSLLDLVGVLLLGLVAALAVTVVQSQPPPAIVDTLAGFLGLSALTGQQLVLVFASAAAVVLLTKSVVSSYLTRRVFIFLANRQALVSARLSKELLSRPLTFLQRRSSQETAFALIQGAGAATVQILGQMVIAVTEIALLVVLAAALLFLDPLMTLGAIAFFALVAFILQKAMGGWAARLGMRHARADIASLNTIQEAVSAYREITVSDRRGLYVDRIGKLRWEAAKVAADTTFIGMFPKYMFEAALVVGGFALAGILFTTQDSVAAVGTLALFLAAGTRVMPSLLRLQGAALGLRGAAGVAASTFELADELGNPLDTPDEEPDGELIKAALAAGHGDFSASISLKDVSFTYPGSSTPALKGVTVDLAPGQSLALVGKSGSGKSTLADLILGVLEPESGSALIGGVPPSEAVHRWPGGIAYVPQEVLLANDTIRNNVALGLPENAIDDDLVWEALRRAHLSEYLTSMREGLDTHIGEGGLKLSGGQRQRLGVARALYTRPRLLVLDEATSALDAETEASISGTIAELEGDVTMVIIAHRLSTVRDANQMLYLQQGLPVALGKFNEIRNSVPSLDKQASLLGF